MGGLLEVLGLNGTRRAADRIVTELAGAIDDLVKALEEADQDVPRGAVPQHLQEAQTLHEKLVSAVGTPDLLEEAAVNTIRKLKTAFRDLLQAHQEQVVKQYRAKLEECKRAASQAKVELDANAVKAVEDQFAAFCKFTYFVPTRMIDEPMAALREALHYAVESASTHAKKLEIAGQALSHHDALCGEGQVRQLLNRIKPGQLTSQGPGPMGFADPKYDAQGYPQVVVSGDAGHFRLSRAEAKDAAMHECVVMPIGEFKLGQITLVEPGESVTVQPDNGDIGFRYRLPEASESWKGKWLKRGVTPETYREVELRELEHLVDFDYAFKLGPLALATAVNRVAEEEFDTPVGPIDALLQDLSKSGAAALIPADPYDSGAWIDRMTLVMLELSGLSKLRDTKGTHSPVDNRASVVSDSVVIHPVFGKTSLDAKDIITLDAIDTVYTGKPPPKESATGSSKQGEAKNERTPIKQPATKPKGPGRALKKGEDATVAETVFSLDLCEKVGGNPVETGRAKSGTSVRIEGDPDVNGIVWASAPEGDVLARGMPNGRAYFLINVDAFT